MKVQRSVQHFTQGEDVQGSWTFKFSQPKKSGRSEVCHGRDGHCPAVGQQCLKCHKAGHTEDQRHVCVCARAHARAFVACVCVFGVCACV